MSASRNRVEILHGVNFSQLGRRNPEHYGGLNLRELEGQIVVMGEELGLTVRCFQTEHEGEYVEEIHRLHDLVDAAVLNPGAWTHYAWALHDAVDLCNVPVVEVHLSDVQAREPWRRTSVISDLCLETVSGQGVEGYRTALTRLARELGVPS